MESRAASPAESRWWFRRRIFSLLKYHSLLVCRESAGGGRLCQLGRGQQCVPGLSFIWQGSLLAAFLVIHGVIVSLLVGLLYGAMLPMFPQATPSSPPASWCRFLFGQAYVYSALGIVSPILDAAHRLVLVR
jgi:hypothetical protein